jgi:hypothetical protein
VHFSAFTVFLCIYKEAKENFIEVVPSQQLRGMIIKAHILNFYMKIGNEIILVHKKKTASFEANI